MNAINLKNIRSANARIKNHIHLTPVMQSEIINKIVGRKVFFKCEHLQKTGSFKIRGALNNLLAKSEKSPLTGVVTHSSGNHGQAVAFASKTLNIPSYIVVPEGTSKSKCAAIESYGGRLVLCGDSPRSRVDTCARLSEELGLVVTHPFDDNDTIAGQGTVGLEFLTQVPQLDAVLIAISGGGLAAGCAVAMKSLKPHLKVYCVEPEGKDLQKSLMAGERLWQGEQKFLNTIADGIRLQQPGLLTFPILCEYVEKEVFTADNRDMLEGMRLSMTYLKQVIEAAAGACLGALMRHNDRIPPECVNIGVVFCGGNTDVDLMLAGLA